LLNVSRNLGGTFGISVAQAMLIERSQAHQARIVEGLNPLNPNYTEGLGQISKTLGGGDMTNSLSVLYQQAQQQAAALSYNDVFHVFMIFVLVITPLGLFVRQGKAAGAHG
jgi:DHA2 family multidrug resistance protein